MYVWRILTLLQVRREHQFQDKLWSKPLNLTQICYSYFVTYCLSFNTCSYFIIAAVIGSDLQLNPVHAHTNTPCSRPPPMTRVCSLALLMSDVFPLSEAETTGRWERGGGRGWQMDSGLAYATSTKGFTPFSVFTSDIRALDTALRAKDNYSLITELLNET